MGKVHIIMAAYNGAAYLTEQIMSIRQSTFTEWELWIFDDGSLDETEDIISRQEAEANGRIHYIKNVKNKGVTLNFLEGVKTVSSQTVNNSPENESDNYYMFCDQDDVWMPDKIEKTLKAMKRYEKKYSQKLPLVIFTDAMITDEKLNVINPSFHKSNHLNTGKLDLPHIMMENKLIGCTVMFNAALEKKLTVLPKQVRYHDWWIGLLGAAFGHMVYLPFPTLYYRQHGGNVVGNQDFYAYVRKRIAALKEQKKVLYANASQAKEFYEIYRDSLSEDKKMQVYAMSNLMEKNWFCKRYQCLRFGFLKSGLVRNIALLLIL
ncbi:glycosyltransferase family 2 protein [Anaerocolumna xylanovorans]|uniref:Glycosyl transferase family 2 n=1 Tax=Anaerocolumna xylanovorans DSM 12503 TaxID=1121345 RepID=A0A1M7YIY5_9FIRM|nr:glycosyltransferase family 2 protein [Anaerocolumna xylanovorans]SHO52605.1 Glycosyl transferase family 2 [Anaerocolumna xylanovorans DSM 12503]